ncbi:ANTAR domain-containing protein [Streptomyces sp. cg35]|uniref:ANTAR domain-containing protein n=1 Tax=Streptomyces sp. cg35 TaxID=3421650 RepID=UPI003D164191
MAGTLELQRPVEESRSQTENLEKNLAERVLIEQAKRLLAAQHGVPVEVAMAWLRQQVRDEQCTVVEVVRGIVEARTGTRG